MKKLSCFAILLIALLFVFVGCEKDQSGVMLENYDEFCGAIESSKRMANLVRSIVGVGSGEEEISLYDPEEGTGISAEDLANMLSAVCDDRIVLEVTSAEGKVSQFIYDSDVEMYRSKAEGVAFEYKYMKYNEVPGEANPFNPMYNEKEYTGEVVSGKFVADGEFILTKADNPDDSIIYTVSTSGLSVGDKSYRDIYAKYMNENSDKSFISARIGGEDINLKLLNLQYQEF